MREGTPLEKASLGCPADGGQLGGLAGATTAQGRGGRAGSSAAWGAGGHWTRMRGTGAVGKKAGAASRHGPRWGAGASLSAARNGTEGQRSRVLGVFCTECGKQVGEEASWEQGGS